MDSEQTTDRTFRVTVTPEGRAGVSIFWMEHPASFFGWALKIIAPPNDWPFTWKLRLIGCRVPPFSRALYVSRHRAVR